MKLLFSKAGFLFIFFLALFLITVACHKNDESENLQSNQGKRNTFVGNDEKKPKYWEEIYFRAISEKISSFKISSLRDKKINDGGLEIRIWVGFDESELKGIILKMDDNNWTGFYLPQKSNSSKKIVELKNPQNGWKSFEKQLLTDDFYNIPDVTESKDNIYTDARCIVVEIKTSEKYRNFMQVEDVNLKDYPELKSLYSTKLTDICKFIEKEFNVSLT